MCYDEPYKCQGEFTYGSTSITRDSDATNIVSSMSSTFIDGFAILDTG